MLNLNFKRSPIKWTAMTFAVSLAIIFSKSSFCEEKNSLNFIDDIPLMESMKIEPELSFSFDSPSGRVTVLTVTSSDNKELIMEFYRQVMPSLGWEAMDEQYKREEEKFQIISSTKKGSIIWRLSISPLHEQ